MRPYNQNRSESVCGGRIVLSLFLILSLMILCPSVSSGDDYENYQQAYTAVETLSAEIRASEGFVGQTLSEAMQGKHGEIEKWTALDEKMSELGQAIDKNLPEIGKNANVLYKTNPDVNLPRVSLGTIFAGNLKMMTSKKNEISNLAKIESGKLEGINAKLAKVNELQNNAMTASATDFIFSQNPLPNDFWEFGGESVVAVLALYSNPVGWVVVIGAGVKGGVSFVSNLYYSSKTLKDRLLAYSQIKELLLEKKKVHEENLKNFMDKGQEMQRIVQILEKNEKKMDEYKAKVNIALDGWNDQSKNAFEEKKKKLDEEAQKKAAQPKPDIAPSSWVYGMSPIPPITSGEYAGEIDSMISQMRSYTQAVEDGGDPDNFQSMVTDWHNRLNERYMSKKEEYDQKYKSYNQASETCWRTIDAARQDFDRTWNAIWNGCKPWNDQCRAALSAAGARYEAAQNAAYAALRPFGQTMISPYREMVRLSQISYRVNDAYYPFRERVDNATRAHTRDFWNEFRLWETKFAEANIKTFDTVADVPYWLDQWKERAARLDGEIQESLKWGGNIVDIRNGLLATAAQLKEMDRIVRDAAKKYATANSERMSVANKAGSELTSITNRYGRLINYYWSSNFYMGWLGSPMAFTPHAPDLERNMEYVTELVRKTFNIYEPENIVKAQKFDFIGIGAIYENKANELTFFTDWIDQYQNRLQAVAGRLDRISGKQTGTFFYAPREDVRATLDKEFSQAPFGGIMNKVDGLFAAEELGKLPWIKVQPWASMSPWQKLYAGQNVLMYKLQEDLKTYVQSRSQGWFLPVREEVIKPLEEKWQKLRALCEQYDATAKPLSENIGNAAEEIVKEAAPVWETWNKMPALSRNTVSGQHSRFQAAYGWLSRYVTDKKESLKSTLEPPTNSVAMQLDNLIAGYRPALEKYREQQAEQQRRFEEQQRRFAEEEKKRAEEERLRVEAVQKKSDAELNAVKDLYSSFKTSYESRNDSQVISFMGDEWQAGDGTTLSDLQVNLSRSFRTFDDIKYTIQNLSITPNQAGRFNVSYDVTITSRIYRRNLKHEEKSSINEEVTINSSGKAKITKTVGGRFWYVQ